VSDTYPNELMALLRDALEPLKRIADAYDDDGLDEERPDWIRRGVSPPIEGRTVELFTGRGGRQLLTLQHAFAARAALALATAEPAAPEHTGWAG